MGFRTMDSGGAKITLDQESFKALASDVRVGILKRLDVRRETVTDLSNLMTLSKPTLLEHLEKLQSAGLVKRVDEGRKWIYYELSDKGRKILHPERVAITLALGIAVALAAIGAFLVLTAEVAIMPGSPGLTSSAPSAERSLLSGPFGFAALAFGLAIASGVVALALRFIGQRRRERFFEQMGAA
ncbi:MAG TPA: winged helix-turn-helix domain-containing protein [Thermoplasmata archaeon]|nr:winged helix-turn-helix domain-containing protein [Thermoplasmata archaeon]